MTKQREWFDSVAQELGVRPKVLEADIKDMAWTWEEAVMHIRRPSAKAVFFSLRAATRSYLRGRGLRMGNWQGWEKHSFTETMLMMCLINYVIGEEGVVFRALHQAGLSSIESYLDRYIRETAESKGKRGFDILDQVKRMLDDGGDP